MRLLSQLGVAEYATQRVDQLSIGQQQRVAAASGFLIGAPELVVADEPTSALDPEATQQFMELLSTECARQGSAFVLVSHDPAVREGIPLWLDLGGEPKAQHNPQLNDGILA